MDRKYLAKTNPADDNDDPLNPSHRRFQFQKQPFDGESESMTINQEEKQTQTKSQPTSTQSKTLDSHDLKKARLNENLKFLQGDSDFVKKTEFANIGKEFESDKIGQEVTGLLYQYEKQKIAMTQRQIQEERALVQELNEKVEQNIAKFVNLESKLKHKQEELEIEVRLKSQKLIESERMAAIGELSSRLAHDLKNPLSVLKMFTEIIKIKSDDNSDPTFMNKLDAANAAIYRMTHQIDNVLDYVRNTPLQKINTTIHEIINVALAKIPEINQISLTIEQKNMPVYCDKAKMSIVFINLLLNSIQAMQSQGKILVNFYQNDGNAIIEFIDSGPGIPPTLLPKVFDPLFTTKQHGTGLGLATCKNIIEGHGGKIFVKNNPTTFTLIIPNNLRSDA
ncbi:MAG: GHKL domain-containing protein [Thaumarchaeota archaeon]|nr:GHKL domain-containing protein [Nitrososphaerota archaeon]